MAVHFHKLTVKNIRHETADCVSIAFDIPNVLAKDFSFDQGQSITLKTIINSEEIRRTYSICSAPFENELRIAVKKADGGSFSTYINDNLKKGDELEVLPPTGNFNTNLYKKNKKNYIAFAAGSGITPVISIIKTTLQTEPLSSFTLIYGSRNRSAIIFFEELQGLKDKYIQRFNLINILSREKTENPINSGRIDAEKLKVLEKNIDYKSFDEAFICGPIEMIFVVKEFLDQEGIAKEKIHFELFTVPGQKQSTVKKPLVINENIDEQSDISVKVDGRSFNFRLLFNSINILDAALQQGADLPFACKGGVCSSCKARLVEGEVEMDANFSLEPEEVAQGFILCCQSHPKTKKVVIDFDIK
jgi:ring-1,2-phenylacetyl-CoA epoxidase subunit PaaE